MSNPTEEMRPEEKLGEFIARVRVSRGMKLEELSDKIKLNVTHVKSIEASDWKAFPVAAYVRGYLRSISQILNLNADEVLKAYSAEVVPRARMILKTFLAKRSLFPSRKVKSRRRAWQCLS